ARRARARTLRGPGAARRRGEPRLRRPQYLLPRRAVYPSVRNPGFDVREPGHPSGLHGPGAVARPIRRAQPGRRPGRYLPAGAGVGCAARPVPAGREHGRSGRPRLGGLPALQAARAGVRRRALMENAVAFDSVSKRYRGGGSRYASLRHDMTRAVRTLGGLLRRGPRGQAGTLALDRVSFEVDEGEAFGIIGPNGAGKSTILKLIARITYPSGGRIRLRGRVGALIAIGAGIHP